MKTKVNLIKNVLTIALLSSPLVVGALGGGGGNIEDIMNVFKTVLRAVIPLLMVLATVIFLWGVITYITAGGEEEKIRNGRTYMLWGVIALFVMIAVWGLVYVIANTFTSAINSNAGIPNGPQ